MSDQKKVLGKRIDMNETNSDSISVKGVQDGSARPDESAPLEPALQAHIGRRLRAAYEEVLNEDVPDRFLDLLKALDREAEPKE